MASASHAATSPIVEERRARTHGAAAAKSRSPEVVKIALFAWLAMLPVTMLTPPLKELIEPLTGSLSGLLGAELFSLVKPLAAFGFQSINMLGAFICVPMFARFFRRRGILKFVAFVAFTLDGLLLASMSIAPNVMWLLGIRFLEGAAHVLGLSALMAIGASFAPEHRRGRAMGLIGAAMMFGTACGTRLGGEIWTLSPKWFFFIAGLIAAFTALCTLLFASDPQPDQKPDAEKSHWTQILRTNPSLGIAYAYALIDRFCVGVVISTFVLYLANIHALPAKEISQLLFLFLFPFALLVYPAGRLSDRIGRVRPIALGSAGFGIVFAAYGMIPLSWMPAAMIVSGVLSALMFAPNLTLCADLAPISRRGAAFAGFNVAGSLGFLLGPIVAGAALALMWWMEFSPIAGYRMAFLVAGGGEVLCAAITLPMLRDLSRRGITR